MIWVKNQIAISIKTRYQKKVKYMSKLMKITIKIIKKLMKINYEQSIIFYQISLNQKPMNKMIIMIKLINKNIILKKIKKNFQKDHLKK